MRVAFSVLFVALVTAPLVKGQDPEFIQRKAPDHPIPSPKEVNAAIAQGVKLLLANQERYVNDRPVGTLRNRLAKWQEGEVERLKKIRKGDEGKGQEWPYEGVYRVGGGIVPPGYRVGGSAIVCEALVEAPGFKDDAARKAAVERSLQFMVDELEKNDLLAPSEQSSYDVRGWGQAYALKFFLRAQELKIVPTALAPRIRKLIPHLIECLKVGQVRGGGWNYAGRGVSPFMTGATLMALYDAKAKGFEVDPAMINDALSALDRARTDAGSFAYSGNARGEVLMPGSSARSAIAELVRFRAGQSSVEKLKLAVDGFFEGWNDLLWRKSEEGTHIGKYSIAPYYFMFGHTYCGMAIEYLPEGERAEYRGRLQQLLWRTRQENGGWNDRVFPRSESYSTAMAMLALLAPSLPTVPEYQAPKKQ